MLADVERARDAVAEVRDLRGGTLGFGMFGTASAYLIADLAADFRRKYPDVRLRLVGQNSSEVADQVRDAHARGGARSSCRSTTPGSSSAWHGSRSSSSSAATPSASREPVTIEALAEAPLILYDAQYGADDPMRRQLVDRAQRAGVTLRPVIEVEDIEAAVELARRGLGDTIVPRAAISRQGVRGLHFASFAEPMYETFAFIARTRRSRSPPPRAPSSRSSSAGSSAWPRCPCTPRARPRRMDNCHPVLSPAVDNLVAQLTRLPGIGTRTAQRLTFHLLSVPREEALALAEAIVDVKERVRFCRDCGNLTEEELCVDLHRPTPRPLDRAASSSSRSTSISLERTHEFRGLYHVLGGSLSPLDGVEPSDLRVGQLLDRVEQGGDRGGRARHEPEHDGRGDGRLPRRPAARPRPVTRLASGLPVGGDLEYADEVTLGRALAGRRPA